MGCKVPRKGPRRAPRRAPAGDPDLADLAHAISTCQLDRNARSWFEMPWRDPWNAVLLAVELAQAESILVTGGITVIDAEALALVRCAARVAATDTDTYFRADELLRLCTGAPLVAAALRCLQLVASHSDGGGEVPSVVLRIAYERQCEPGAHEMLIAEYRAVDAIGTNLSLRSDAHDPVRRAFRIAWERGLYRACYALPHVSQKGARA